MLFVLALSWIVFGRYFYLSITHGLQSTDQLTVDFILRKALQVQQVIVLLISLLMIKRGGKADLVVSLLMAGILGTMIIG